MSNKSKMRLNLEYVTDLYMRENFLAIQRAWNEHSFNKGDYEWFEYEITEASDALKLYHNLGFIPQDAIVTKSIGSSYTFDYDLWTDEYIVINTSGELYLRVHIGSMDGLTVGGQEILGSVGGTVLGEGTGITNIATVGPQGPQGTNGIDGIDGTNGIDGVAGLDGQSAYEVAFYSGYTGDETAWLLSLIGADGLQGDAGLDGSDGIQGIQGDAGLDGSDGSQGIQGDTGLDGLQGIQGIQGDAGLDGSDGTQGIQGEAGLDGSDGIQGETGLTGNQGIQGEIGLTGATGLDGMQFPWDDITKTSPSPIVDLYTYTLLTVNVRTITITYASFLKAEILSIVKVEF